MTQEIFQHYKDDATFNFSPRDQHLMNPLKVVLVDAFDSFVYVIVQYIGQLGYDPVILRSDPSNIARIAQLQPDFLVLGPGPGSPEESGHVEIVQEFAGKIPIMGVCLGHQAIGVAYGAKVGQAQHIMHGKSSSISHDNKGMFKYIPDQATVTRYHSLIIEDDSLPKDLIVTARSDDDHYIMGVRHTSLPIEGVQFHPESIGTREGAKYISSFVDSYVYARNDQCVH